MERIIVELTANALDIAVLTLLFCKRFPGKYNTVLPTVVFVFTGLFLESLPVFVHLHLYPLEIILFSTCLIFLFFRHGSWLHKLFWVSVSFVTIFALAMIVSPIISVITRIDVREMDIEVISSARILYLSITNIIKVVIFYLLSNKPRRIQKNSISVLVCMIIPTVSIVFGTCICKIYVNSSLYTTTDYIIILLAVSYLLISISSIVLYEIIEKDSERMVYLLTKESQYEIMSRYTDQIKHMNNEIKVWQHDMKQHLTLLQTLIESQDHSGAEEYLSKLSDKAKLSYLKINSGNYIADAVLSSKIDSAGKKGIKVECTASIPEDIPLDDVDFCSILSNTIENAIEAAENVDVSAFINCDIVTIKNQLIIEIENSTNGEYNYRDGIFDSIKTSGIHGIGLRQVQSIVDKYDGICTIDAGKDKFKISISIPMGVR